MKTARDALQLIASGQGNLWDKESQFDIILKEHEPPAANACRLLRKMARSEVLRRIPVVGEADCCFFW